MIANAVRAACLAVGAAVAGFALAGAPPADAAVNCSATAVMPARVIIDRPDVVMTTHVATNCADYLVSAYLNGPGGNLDYLVFDDSQSSQATNFSAYSDKPGSYRTVDAGDNYSSGGSAGVDWISTATTFKYVTYDYVSSSRVGRAVYINGLVKNYAGGYDGGLVRGAGRTVYLQRHLASGWQTMLARTANSTGQISVGFVPSAVQQYRLITTETATAWNGISASTVR